MPHVTSLSPGKKCIKVSETPASTVVVRRYLTTQNGVMYSRVLSVHWLMIIIMMTMIMEATNPPKTSVLFNRTTKRDMPENSYLEYQII
jgi:hypothetical protein